MRRLVFGVVLLLLLSPGAALAQGLGIVTTVDGQVTVARAAQPSPISLKLRDDIFARDRVSTAAKSFARMLFAGKALVSVRELSTLTVGEDSGISVVDLGSGKISFGLQRGRVTPGERYEIRTENAIVAVRGTVVVANASVRGNVPITDYYVPSGTGDVRLRRVAGPTVPLRDMQAITITGDVLGPVRTLTAAEMAQALLDLRGKLQRASGREGTKQAVDSQQSELSADVDALRGQTQRNLTGTPADPRRPPVIPTSRCSGGYC